MFPLTKQNVRMNNSETNFLDSYENETEIPVLPHPGAFGKERKFHQHEGVDLYCEEMDEVFNMEKGVVIGIFPFTGEIAGSPWWNNTYSVLVKCANYVFNYGEVIPNQFISVGDEVDEGVVLGWVVPVLKKDKGRPMTMLHIEMYKLDTVKPITSWNLGEEKPMDLLDPTDYLKEQAKNFLV